MMKKILLPFLLICGFAGIVFAQEVTNIPALKRTSTTLRLAENANYLKAMTMAKEKGWALSIRGKNGSRAVLTGVDDFGYPCYFVTHSNSIAAATTRANQLWPGGASGLNLSGSTANMKNKLGIWDEGGVLTSHVELTGRVLQKDNPSSNGDHSTHVTGTMMASGVNPAAKGMAFGLQGMFAYDFNNDLSEMTAEAANLVLSNHSYGRIAGWYQNLDQSGRWEFYGDFGQTEDYKFGYYDTRTQALDSLAYNAPFYLMVRSAGNSRDENGPAVGEPYFRFNASGQMATAGARPGGIYSNDGYDILPYEACAKNVLTIGAVNGLPTGYSVKEDVVMSSFSNWGPTDDGRIKPDLVADGVNVTSPIATSNNNYATYSGTSMSSPNTTGSLLLLQEHYSKLKSGAFMRSATLKGLAIHTADESGTTPGPDYSFGWGLLNVEKAAAVITAAVPANNTTTGAHQLYENTMTQGGSFTINVVASGKGPLTATICWTDVKGDVDLVNKLNNRTRNLVNDLDIRVTATVGGITSTYLPWKLDGTNPGAAATRGDNNIDNVEKIEIDSTVPGRTYTITVTHKGTLARTSQAYSLLVSNVGGTAYCASTSTGGGARIDSVSFKTIHVGNPAGSKTYTDYTQHIADIEAGQTVPIAVKVGTTGATVNQRFVKVFIDYNNDGDFNDANELAATSTALTTTGQMFNGSIVTPTGLPVGTIYLMRIVVMETAAATNVAACGTSYGQGETQDYRVRVTSPTNDVSISAIVAPNAFECSSSAQYFTIDIKNNGSVSQSNIPITVSASTGGSVLNNLTFTYPGTIAAGATARYTFQPPSVTSGGTTYTLTATTGLSTDQNPANNTFVTTILTVAKPASATASATICGNTVNLKVINPDLSNYYWYTTPTGTTPFATGPTASTTTITSDKTYYVTKEAKIKVGPVNKNVFTTGGGYNAFNGNYIKINNSVPVVIQTARLYIGNAGKVRFILADLLSEDATTGSYSYRPLAISTVDVYPTTPTPGLWTNAVSTNDTGAIFLINLPVVSVGDHIIITQCLNNQGDTTQSSTIFRNNNIVGSNTYPMGVPNVMTITGNSAHIAPAQESQFYYFFYDMTVYTGCVSDRVAVIASTAIKPVISNVGDSLVSSVTTGSLQWYLNDTAINGATTRSIKPTRSGIYKIIATDASGCQQASDPFTFVITALAVYDPREIGLSVSPNPNNGVFNLSFEVTTKADLSIEILSSSGQRIYNRSYPGFTGKFSKQITAPQVSSEFYILKVHHNKKNYVQKIIIQR
jgi:hypothetical protein